LDTLVTIENECQETEEKSNLLSATLEQTKRDLPGLDYQIAQLRQRNVEAKSTLEMAKHQQEEVNAKQILQHQEESAAVKKIEQIEVRLQQLRESTRVLTEYADEIAKRARELEKDPSMSTVLDTFKDMANYLNMTFGITNEQYNLFTIQ
jgi:chromosome segregation ATPase